MIDQALGPIHASLTPLTDQFSGLNARLTVEIEAVRASLLDQCNANVNDHTSAFNTALDEIQSQSNQDRDDFEEKLVRLLGHLSTTKDSLRTLEGWFQVLLNSINLTAVSTEESSEPTTASTPLGVFMNEHQHQEEDPNFRPSFKVTFTPGEGTVASFLQIFEVAMDGATDKQKARHVLSCLSREAQEVLAPLLRPGMTWNVTRTLLLNEFGSAQDVRNLKTEFLSLKLGRSSLETFANHFYTLAQQLSITRQVTVEDAKTVVLLAVFDNKPLHRHMALALPPCTSLKQIKEAMLEIKMSYPGDRGKPLNPTIKPPKNIKRPGIMTIDSTRPACAFCNKPGHNADHCYDRIASLDNPADKRPDPSVMMITPLHQNIQDEDDYLFDIFHEEGYHVLGAPADIPLPSELRNVQENELPSYQSHYSHLPIQINNSEQGQNYVASLCKNLLVECLVVNPPPPNWEKTLLK